MVVLLCRSKSTKTNGSGYKLNTRFARQNWKIKARLLPSLVEKCRIWMSRINIIPEVSKHDSTCVLIFLLQTHFGDGLSNDNAFSYLFLACLNEKSTFYSWASNVGVRIGLKLGGVIFSFQILSVSFYKLKP